MGEPGDGVELDHQSSVISVDHQPWETVVFAVNQPIPGRGVIIFELAATIDCGDKPVCEEVFGDFTRASGVQDPDRDRGVRIPQTDGDKATFVVEDHREVSGLARFTRAGYRLVPHPGVAASDLAQGVAGYMNRNSLRRLVMCYLGGVQRANSTQCRPLRPWRHDWSRLAVMGTGIEANERVTVVDHPLVQHKLTYMRDEATPPALFRRLLRETSVLLAYEALRSIATVDTAVVTPLGPTIGQTIETDPVLISILRAGNGLLDGFLDVVPSARVGFIGLYRDHETLQAIEYYENVPSDLGQCPVVVVDPMLATANTAIAAVEKVRAHGAVDLTVVSLVASPEGINQLCEADSSLRIVVAGVDDGLDHRGYIVPGLGDAGDRMYGTT